MLSSQTIQSTQSAIVGLDLSDLNDRLAALDNERRELDVAISSASQRLDQIRVALASDSPINAEAIADAILSGADPQAAADRGPAKADLMSERDSLRAALDEIGRRQRNVTLGSNKIMDQAGMRACEAVKPLADGIADSMRNAAEQMVDAYAAAAALNDIAPGFGLINLSARLAVAGLIGTDAILGHRRSAVVPKEVADLIGALATKGPALSRKPRDTVPMP